LPYSSVLLLNVVAHKSSGPPVLQLHLTNASISAGGQTCHRLSVSFQKDVMAKTGAESLVCTDSSTRGLKEERPCMTEGCRKKGEMVGLESANGQV